VVSKDFQPLHDSLESFVLLADFSQLSVVMQVFTVWKSPEISCFQASKVKSYKRLFQGCARF